VAKVRKKELPARWQALPDFVRTKSVFLSEPVMAMLGIGFGDWVAVNGRDACRAWPMNFGGLKHVAAAPSDGGILRADGEERAVVAKLDSSRFSPAIKIKFSGNFPASQVDLTELTSLVSHFCRSDEIALRCGSTLRFPFYAKPLNLSVTEVTATDAEVSDITSRLGNVSLAKSSKKPGVQFGIVNSETVIEIVPLAGCSTASVHARKGFAAVGGLGAEIDTLEKALKSLHASSEERWRTLRSLSGILLWGPSGTGKTLLASSLHRRLGLNQISVSTSEVFSKFFGETESKLRAKFDEAKEKQPCVILLDDIDVLCPTQKDGGKSDQEKRIVSALVSMLDDLNATRERVIVLATTNRRSAIDSRLLRLGRLDLEVEIGVPSSSSRRDILQVLLSDLPSGHTLTPADVESVAKSTHGFVGMDLKALLSEAENEAETGVVTLDDFKRAVKKISPSAMKEVLVDVPTVTWEDIGGLEELKLSLRQAVEWPLKRPEVFKRFGITPPKGLLMYGPPGCSKTMIAKALANQSGLNFLAIKGPELFSKWVGESEQAVRDLFRKAKQVAPAIIFFDEIDALGSERGGSGGGSSKVGDRVLAQLLTEMDGIEQLKDVTIVAATNRPDMIDAALMRPGRFDRLFYVSLPDAETRRKVFDVHTRKKPIAADVDFAAMVENTEGYSGAEIEAVCNEAGMKAMEEDLDATEIKKRHFDLALKSAKPRIDEESLKVYEKFAASSK
jgi:AAA family ATPase